MNQDFSFYFDNYLGMGLEPILLQYGSKKPLLKNWNVNYNFKIWKKILNENCKKNFNIAILLGKIVDVEGDSVEANELILNIIGDYPHPCFQSSRSIHHLFLNPDPDLTVKKFHNIEFRANKVCSVMPPSVHEDGTIYQFLKNSHFPVPVMPVELREFYFTNKNLNSEKANRNKFVKPLVKRFHTKSFCHKCHLYQFIHRQRLALEIKAFAMHETKWMCHKCRNLDVRELCRKIKSDLRIH